MKNYQRSFGAFVKKMRKQKGYSQDKFAEIADLSQAYLSSVERGIANPRLDTLKKIAVGLNIPMTDLFLFDVISEKTTDKRERFVEVIGKMDTKTVDELYWLLVEALYQK